MIFQRGSISVLLKKKPEHIIFFGFDPHIISTIFTFLFAKYILRKKVYWWGHGVRGHQGWLGQLFRRFFYNRSNGILVYSARGKDDLTNMKVKVPIVVVGNALNNEDYGFRNGPVKKDFDILRIIFSGRLTKRKQLPLLLEALQGLQERIRFECAIVGDGPEKNNLQYMIDRLGLKEAKLTGALYGDDLKEYYQRSHLCVIPGDAGLTLIHAMSFGVPVITHNDLRAHGPEIEILKENVNGDYYRKHDVEDLRQKIIKWSELIFEKKDTVCGNCIESVRHIGYTPEAVAKNILSILR
jgi:glycosyltransferase involved in cell wall biosynthesis